MGKAKGLAEKRFPFRQPTSAQPIWPLVMAAENRGKRAAEQLEDVSRASVEYGLEKEAPQPFELETSVDRPDEYMAYAKALMSNLPRRHPSTGLIDREDTSTLARLQTTRLDQVTRYVHNETPEFRKKLYKPYRKGLLYDLMFSDAFPDLKSHVLSAHGGYSIEDIQTKMTDSMISLASKLHENDSDELETERFVRKQLDPVKGKAYQHIKEEEEVYNRMRKRPRPANLSYDDTYPDIYQTKRPKLE